MELDALIALVRRADAQTHTLAPCACWRCVAHQDVLDTANAQHTKNAVFAQHLEATRRRARRRAVRLVPEAA